MCHFREEGYVKYIMHWQKRSLPAYSEFDALMYYRNILHHMKLIGTDDNGIGFGNISCRVGESGSFIISGSQTGRIAVTTQDHFCLVTKTDVDANELFCKGPVKASSEALTHAAFYNADKDAKAVMHVHHLELWELLLNNAPTTDINIPYGTPEMAHEIKRLTIGDGLLSKKIMITAGHREGIFTFGKELAAAYEILMLYYNQMKMG